MGLVCERMRRMAHRMLGRFPVVRRWSDTDDIVQNASLRLWKSLEEVSPDTVRAIVGLVGLQIRRELLDLAKHFSRPGNFAANHDSNAAQVEVGGRSGAPEPPDNGASLESLERWSTLHEAAASLPEPERELFHLVWYVGLQQAEAARLLDCSVRTIKRRWESVKTLLRQFFPNSPPE